jgi:hypothetical protein
MSPGNPFLRMVAISLRLKSPKKSCAAQAFSALHFKGKDHA